MELLHVFSFVLLLPCAWQVNGVCQDLSTDACVLMQKQSPNLCQDSSLAETACPKFCNLCPLTCYHCDDISTSAENCTTLRECARGEKCLLARYLSSADGHYEYKMNCANYEHCEGREYLSILGRRDVGRRTISTECCTENKCNNPAYYSTTPPTTAATTTTATTTAATTTTTLPPTTTPKVCVRDIEILIQDSSHQSAIDTMYIKTFLHELTDRLITGPDGAMVGLATFDTSSHSKTSLSSNRTRLTEKIDDMKFNHRQSDVDLAHALDHIVGGHLDPLVHHSPNHNGDYLENGRSHVDNVVIFLFDTSARLHIHSHGAFIPGTSDVIVISVGSSTLSSTLTHMATGANHVLAVTDYRMLSSLESQIMSLICL